MLSYAYDQDGLLKDVTSGASTVASYVYDAAGHPTKATLGNGVIETRGYLANGWTSFVRHAKDDTTISRYDYSYDAAGNPTRMEASGVATAVDGTTTYSCDALDRLTRACFVVDCSSAASELFVRYGYDGVGNRTSETDPSGTTTYAYNAADELQSKAGPNGTVIYDHDKNGNLTRIAEQDFAYDMAGRMTSAETSNGTTYSYGYSGAGTRLKETTSSGAAVDYTWDQNAGLPLLVEEQGAGGAPTRSYTYGLDLIAMGSGSKNYFYGHDALGSVVNVTSGAGDALLSYAYQPFGEPRRTTDLSLPTDPAPGNPMRFTGEYLDPTGLYH